MAIMIRISDMLVVPLKLLIEWDNAPAGNNADYTSDAYRESLEKAAQSPGRVIRQSGDVEAALQKAEKRVSATY